MQHSSMTELAYFIENRISVDCNLAKINEIETNSNKQNLSSVALTGIY